MQPIKPFRTVCKRHGRTDQTVYINHPVRNQIKTRYRIPLMTHSFHIMQSAV